MRGGKSVGIKRACALRQAGVALLAIQFTWVSGETTFRAVAHPDHEDIQCDPAPPREQSIVISAKKLAEGEEPPEAAADDADGGLQPIANVSEYEPELAEAQVPTLAEPADVQQSESSAQDETKTVQPEQPSTLLTSAETEVISFHGITPGISTRINVLRTWGDPRSDDTQADELKYRFDDLPAVVVRFEDNRVTSIVVELQNPMPVSKLARKLDLQRVRPVTMVGADGTASGQAYPERGVVLRLRSRRTRPSDRERRRIRRRRDSQDR